MSLWWQDNGYRVERVVVYDPRSPAWFWVLDETTATYTATLTRAPDHHSAERAMMWQKAVQQTKGAWQSSQPAQSEDRNAGHPVSRRHRRCGAPPPAEPARGNTGQCGKAENFLLAWWNAGSCGGWDLTDLWAVDAAIAANPEYPTSYGLGAEFEGLVARWHPHLLAQPD